MYGSECMNRRRAQEIIESHGVIEVLHQKRPVWIEEVYDSTARIKYLDNEKSKMVRLDDLIET